MTKMNLVPAIKAIEKQIADIKCEYEKQIKPYEESLKKLREINDVCECCNGKGKILRPRACAEDDIDPKFPGDYIICPNCVGTGQAPKVKEEPRKWSLP